MKDDTISRQAAIDALDALCDRECEYSKQQRSFMCGACRLGSAFDVIDELPSAQPEIIHCKECKCGVQDEDKRWYCRSLGCQIGNEDGSGFCADAERRE